MPEVAIALEQGTKEVMVVVTVVTPGMVCVIVEVTSLVIVVVIGGMFVDGEPPEPLVPVPTLPEVPDGNIPERL